MVGWEKQLKHESGSSPGQARRLPSLSSHPSSIEWGWYSPKLPHQTGARSTVGSGIQQDLGKCCRYWGVLWHLLVLVHMPTWSLHSEKSISIKENGAKTPAEIKYFSLKWKASLGFTNTLFHIWLENHHKNLAIMKLF